jgi:hypothetical protein
MYVRYTLFNYVYINLFIFLSQSFCCFIWRDAIRCKQIKLLITSTFAGSWFEIQRNIITSLVECMVGCAWSGLRRLSHSDLESLTLNFSYTETSTDVDLRHHGSISKSNLFSHYSGVSEKKIYIHLKIFSIGQLKLVLALNTGI